MTKISKLFLAILSSALLISPSYAGEMTVTGGAKATYTTSGDAGSEGKTIGISNELDFTASEEPLELLCITNFNQCILYFL